MVKSRKQIVRVFVLLAMTVVLSLGTAFASPSHEGHTGSSVVDRPLWLDKLENQVNYEEMMEGKQGNQDRLNKTYKGLMDRLKGKLMEHASPASSGGVFHNSWAAHQL